MNVTIKKYYDKIIDVIIRRLYKKELYLVAFARPKASLDGVGVALKVKVRQSNEDISSTRLCRGNP